MKPIELERQLEKEISGIEVAIADISKQLAAIAQQKQQLAVPALAADEGISTAC